MKNDGGDVGVGNGVVNGETVHEEHATARDDDQSDHTEPPRSPSTEKHPANSHQYRSRRYCHIRFEWPKFALEILTLGVIVFYAYQAERQAHGTRVAANAARDSARAVERSNIISRQNSITDLRAYVSLGDKNGNWISVTRKDTVTLNFYNAGRTPARHLLVTLSVSGKGVPYSASHTTIRHIERIEVISGEAKGGTISTSSGVEIAGGEVVQLPQTKEGVDFTRRDLGIVGYFEYCDVFGQWHCDQFSSWADSVVGGRRTYSTIPGEMMFCDPNDSPYIAEERTRIGARADKQYKALARCEKGD